MNRPPEDLERAVRSRDGKSEGDEIRFRCPHPDRHRNGDAKPSARYHPGKGVWRCDVCGEGGGWVSLAQLLNVSPPRRGSRIVATYPYTDENGNLLFEVVRKEPKDFRQRRPDGVGGWIWSLKDVRRVLFRLPEIVEAVDAGRWIYLVEGEKDADNLARLGLDVTTSPGGAGNWQAAYSETLRGARVAILPDNDEPGRRHVDSVAAALATGTAEVRVVELPGLPPGGDVSDWLDGLAQGVDPARELSALVDQAKPWTSPNEVGEGRGAEDAGPVEKTDAVLNALEAMKSPVDLTEVERALIQLRERASALDALKRGVLRERALAALKGKVQSPARLVDVALQGGEAPSLDKQGSGTVVSLETAEPWSEPVDGGALLDEIRSAMRAYVILPEGAATATALWVVHTYAFDSGLITPRLAITSPVKRCAKTLVLTMLEQFVAKPLLIANVTAAALFRVVEHVQPTLLIDEADTFLQGKDELRGILNSGHRRGGSVLRVAGDDHEPRQFSTFAPVAIAKIGGLPDTLADRSIAIEMRRKAKDEEVTPLRLDRLDHLAPIRQRCARWVGDHREDLGGVEPVVPSGLNDRAADNWRPLLAIAELAGGEWPQRARRAVGCLSTKDGGDVASAREDLLADIRGIFERSHTEAMFTDQLLGQLHGMEERQWPEWRKGKPISAVQLARLLRDFKVKPRSIRIGSETRKGYKITDFAEAFRRYLPSETSHPSQPSNDGALRDSSTRHTESRVTPRESPQTPANSGSVTGVTPQNGEVAGWMEV